MPQLLFQHIQFAPEEMQAKFSIGIDKWFTKRPDVINEDTGRPQRNPHGKIITLEKTTYNPEYWKAKFTECCFIGLLFREGKVYVINIYTFNQEKDYEPQYLEVTKHIKSLNKKYNIYHSCLILQLALKNYYKDSTLTENLIPTIKHDTPFRLPKFRYQITKHHNRHKKFIDTGKKGSSDRIWNNIINRAISKIEVCQTATRYGKEGPNLFIDYTSLPRKNIVPHKIKSSTRLLDKKRRVPRRRFGAFNPLSGEHGF